MTSPASTQNVPANPTAPSASASYASAAGASGKAAATPVIATGSAAPVVVGSSASPALPSARHAARSASVSPQHGSAGSSKPAAPSSNSTMSAHAHSGAASASASGTATPIKPALPAVPAVINGSNADHARKSSVTISAAGPSGYIGNGGPAGASSKASMVKFGFDSPSITHSTPQNASAAIPIPGQQHVPSPAHSPNPIPLAAVSGVRPPSTLSQDGGGMKFGSVGNDGDANIGTGIPIGGQSPHFRRGSTHSIHSDAPSNPGPTGGPGGPGGHGGHGGHNHGHGGNNHGHHGGPGGAGRGGYPPQSNRGRGGYNNNNGGHFANQTMPYSPGGPGGGSFGGRGPSGQPRNSMPPQFQPRGMQAPSFGANANQGTRLSPAVQPVVPNNGTPHMAPMIPAGSPGGPGFMPFQYHQNATGFPPPANNYPQPYGPAYASQGMIQHGFPSYGPMGQYVGGVPQPSPGPVYATPYGASPFPVPGPPSMSRTSSQAASERPNSSTGQVQTPVLSQAGVGVAGNGVPQKGAAASTASPFAKKKSNKIVIKTPQGETVDFSHMKDIKAPASPAGPNTPASSTSTAAAPASATAAATPATTAAARTPPVVATSTPTPPPPAKSVTPLSQTHARTESTSAGKTAEQLRLEFKEQVSKAAEAPNEGDKKAKAEDKKPEAKPEAKPVEAKPVVVASGSSAPVPAKDEAKKAEAAVVDGSKSTDAAAAAPVARTPSPAKAAGDKPVAAAEVKKEEAAKEEPEAQEKEASAPAAAAPADEEDEVERMIREMEELEAKREADAAAYEAKKKVETEERKKKEEAERLASAAENDQKLREQEREMERIEEERERQRAANEAAAAAGGKAKSVAEVLAEKISGITLGDRKEAPAAASPTSATTPDALANKLGDLKLSDAGKAPALSPSSEAAAGAGKQQRAKPSALNLTPLNTKAVEPPQPSAALHSLTTARFLRDPTSVLYPKGIQSPNPALNPAVNKKGSFKYDMGFLLQFKDVFTEKPSLDFDQQVKTLIGDGDGGARSGARTPAGGSGRQNSRSNAGTAFNTMGAMGSFNSKPLPSGTTSEQRFAMANGSLPRPAVGGGMSSFGRPGSFPGPSAISRTPSSSLGGGMPNSPRQGSRSARGNSRQNPHNYKAEAQAAKTMPLTAGIEVKPIVVSSTGWKPSSVGNRAAASNSPVPGAAGGMDPEMVQRKVKAALNKMTPEKFDKISDQILEIALQSKDEEDGRTLRQVIQLTFEKATDEAHWAPMYARFCKRMLDQMSPDIRDVTIRDKKGDVISGGTLFRKYLLNRCQEEFERGWKVDLPQPKEGETKEMTMLSDEYYLAAAAKRRGLGLVQFIGELYKLGMLTERIMHACVRKLVDYETTPDEAEIESLSKLLRTVGANLDNTEKGRPMMDAYFERIKNVIEIPDLASRLKFMLMDIVDLRDRHWVSNEQNKGPKTLEEVRQEAEAAAAQKAAEAARSSQRGPGGRGGMGGRGGDARQFAYNQPPSNQVGMDDLRRLKGSASRIASSSVTTLGPSSMFASRSNSGRRNGPGGSFGRPGDDSGPASRTGTPPTRNDHAVSHANAFEALANVDAETPTSPPSVAASPAMSKANVDKAGSK